MKGYVLVGSFCYSPPQLEGHPQLSHESPVGLVLGLCWFFLCRVCSRFESRHLLQGSGSYCLSISTNSITILREMVYAHGGFRAMKGNTVQPTKKPLFCA